LQYGVGDEHVPSPVHAVPPSVDEPPELLPELDPELDPLELDPLLLPLLDPELLPLLDPLDDEVVASPPSSPSDEVVASPPSGEMLASDDASDASSSRPPSSPLSPEEVAPPELEPLDEELLCPPEEDEDEPELEPFIDASAPDPTALPPFDPPHPTAATTATRQASPAQALKAFIRRPLPWWCGPARDTNVVPFRRVRPRFTRIAA